MEKKVGDEVKSIVSEVKEWFALEIEYLKLTAAEKLSLVVSMAIFGVLAVILLFVVMIVLAFALVDLFDLMMPHALACVTVGGIILFIIALLFLLRKPIFVNPVTKLISKTFLAPKKKDEEE